MKTAKNTESGNVTQPGRLVRWSTYALATILVLMPFHAFLTVAIGDKLGNYDALRLWKEAALLLLLIPAGVIIWRAHKQRLLGERRRNSWLLWCVAAYGALHITLGLVALQKGQVNAYAMTYAWVVNLRLLLVFVVAVALASAWPWLRDRWHKILLWPAALVIGFGLLQMTVLPADFLRHFGYSEATIAPFDTVDQKQDYVRIQSTLRGSNPFGAYLVVIIAGLATVLAVGLRRQRQVLYGVLLAVAGLVLAATYSRSAYIGVVVALVVTAGLAARSRRARRWLAGGLIGAAIVAGVAGLALRQNDHFENIFFHTNEHSQSVTSSNEGRLSALQNSFEEVLHEPFGRGPGTAGPASAHNVMPERIAENYYLQVAQEVGWLGLGLFVAINIIIARRLWHRRDQTLSRVLLASLIGIAVINLVQHAWTDDTLAILWWGMAGIAIAPSIAQAAAPAIITAKQSKLKDTSKVHTKHGKHKKKPIKKAKKA